MTAIHAPTAPWIASEIGPFARERSGRGVPRKRAWRMMQEGKAEGYLTAPRFFQQWRPHVGKYLSKILWVVPRRLRR
jgi:hypothetical protein